MRLRFVHPATGSSRDLFFTRRGALRTVYAIGAIGDAITAVRTSRAHRNNKFNKHAEYYRWEDGAEFVLTPPAGFFAPLDGDYLRLSPAEHGCDGFFGAVLTRREGGWSGRGGRRSK